MQRCIVEKNQYTAVLTVWCLVQVATVPVQALSVLVVYKQMSAQGFSTDSIRVPRALHLTHRAALDTMYCVSRNVSALLTWLTNCLHSVFFYWSHGMLMSDEMVQCWNLRDDDLIYTSHCPQNAMLSLACLANLT